VEKVVNRTGGGEEAGVKPGVDYGNLARLIKKAKRNRQFTPRVMGVDLEKQDGRRVLRVDGKNLAFAHWSGPDASNKSFGHRQFCGSVSGDALKQFMDKYPATDAQEPNGG